MIIWLGIPHSPNKAMSWFLDVAGLAAKVTLLIGSEGFVNAIIEVWCKSAPCCFVISKYAALIRFT